MRPQPNPHPSPFSPASTNILYPFNTYFNYFNFTQKTGKYKQEVLHTCRTDKGFDRCIFSTISEKCPT